MSVEVPETARTQSPSSYLYTSVARNHLGNIAAIVILSLISYGRLTCHDISQKSKIPAKLVKTTLVSLVQLNCVLYWKEDKQVFYQFEETGILVLLNAGDIINYIKGEYDRESAEIVQNIIENGHLRIQDYLQNVENEEEKYQKQNLLMKLFNDGWLARLQDFNLSPLNDLWNKLYQDTLKATPRSSTTSEIKRVHEVKEVTKLKFKDLLAKGTSPQDLYSTEKGIRHLNPELILRFNLERFQKHLRNESLQDLCKSRIGILTAQVYGICLKLIEKDSPTLNPVFLKISGLINDPEEARGYVLSLENELIDNKKITFNIRDLASYLPQELDLRNSILTHNFLKPNSKRVNVAKLDHDLPMKKIKTEDSAINIFHDTIEEVDEQEIDFDGATDNSDPHSITLIQHHLKLLTSSTNIPFLTELSPGVYTVSYTQVVKYLQEYNYETVIKTTLGGASLRVLRCLKRLKLADEKILSNSVLLKEKQVRNEIYKLIKLNVVEIQEIPRSTDRAASKTFYLFRHKPSSSYSYLVNSLKFCMGEILTNIQSFKQDNKILLEKCDREDVKGHENELLLESELKILKDLQVREIDNIGRFNRIKSLYNIFETY